jgi:hypothetical protein
MKVKSAC